MALVTAVYEFNEAGWQMGQKVKAKNLGGHLDMKSSYMVNTTSSGRGIIISN